MLFPIKKECSSSTKISCQETDYGVKTISTGIQNYSNASKHCLFLSFLSIACVFFSWSCAYAQLPQKIEVSAHAAILINAETGKILYEKNAHQPMHPASITKIITALYALEKKGDTLNTSIISSVEALAIVSPQVRRAGNSKQPPHRLEFGGSHMGIKIGEVLSFKSLLYGLMLSSGNDAANVIAEYVSGTIPQFVKELNAYVKSKGCLNTTLYAPHGLPHPEHKSSAYDMALLAKEALKFPVFREIVKTNTYHRPSSNLQPETVLHQHNALVRPGGKFYYPKAIGVKTGYLTVAGYTIVAAAEDQNRKLIAVLLKCEHLEQRYRDAIALFEAAFNEEKTCRTLFSKDFDVFSTPIQGGCKPLQAALLDDVVIHYYLSEEQLFRSQVIWQDRALPIRKNDKVGEVCIISDSGEIVERSTLYAAVDVEPTLLHVLSVKCQTARTWLWIYRSYILIMMGLMILSFAFIFHGKRKKAKQS